jgi:hypothetical protein
VSPSAGFAAPLPSGASPFVKVGRNVRFEPEAISRYIERQRRPALEDTL